MSVDITAAAFVGFVGTVPLSKALFAVVLDHALQKFLYEQEGCVYPHAAKCEVNLFLLLSGSLVPPLPWTLLRTSCRMGTLSK